MDILGFFLESEGGVFFVKFRCGYIGFLPGIRGWSLFRETVDLNMISFFLESEGGVSFREDFDLNMLGFSLESEGGFFIVKIRC